MRHDSAVRRGIIVLFPVAVMQFIVKFFPEITIKSRPVRIQLAKALRDNLRRQLRPVDERIAVVREWDRIVVNCPDDEPLRAATVDVLTRTAGIAYFLDVLEFPFIGLEDTLARTLALWQPRLAGKSFAVRCRRVGKHDFSSLDAERFIGGGLTEHCETATVNLKRPDETVRVEIRGQRLYLVNERHPGIGGFPIGTQEPVVSLLSGGFDSTVASYLTMRRGMRTHFCFFNLGGRAHEIGVREVAHYLWSRYGSARRVKLISVPFETVVADILKHVDDAYMGVVLKRVMLRAAAQIAEQLGAPALVTGESVAQVSSQTLTNLTAIDSATDMLVLRPLITMAKGEIIQLATEIGTEPFAAAMPEYCGVISVKPTTRAKPVRVTHEEGKLTEAVLADALAQARYINIDEVADESLSEMPVEILPAPLPDSIVIDVRAPAEAERKPLRAGSVVIEKTPFYELAARAAQFDPGKTYMLYCEKGVMSKLHAAHLTEQGHRNIKVYRPV